MVKTTEQFIEDAKKVHGDKYNYDKVLYINNKTKIIITCPEHGDFLQTPNKHLLGKGCPQCGKIKIINSTRDSLDDFKNKANIIHNYKYNYSKANYINSKTKIEIICPIHGPFWQIPNGHLQGKGCPKCAIECKSKKCRKTLDEFIKQSNKIHNNYYNYTKSNYINDSTKLEIICPKHGSFWQSPNKHLQGEGCPQCKLKSQSKIYQYLIRTFPKLIWEWEASPNWLFPQKFDIYNKKYNIAIEYNGKQHYIPVKHFGGEIEFAETIKRDQLKQQKCKENNCNLYIIKFDNEDLQDLTNYINNIINNY